MNVAQHVFKRAPLPFRLHLSPRVVSEPSSRLSIRGPRDAVAILTPYAAKEPIEVFWVLMLDAQHAVIGNRPVEITRGLLNCSLVHPREVFRPAIIAGASAIIVAHNHPSGNVTPSPEDRSVTEQLVAAGRVLDMFVHDHVIVSALGTYYSFAENSQI